MAIACPHHPARTFASLIRSVVCGLALAVSLTGCASDGANVTVLRPAPFTKYVARNAQPANAAELTKEHCVGGMPRPTGTVAFGQTTKLYRLGYVLEHSDQDLEANWVCSHLTKTSLQTPPRGRPSPEPFKADPDLVQSHKPHAELSDYRGSGYSRGHQSPNADFRLNSDEQKQTYYLSNMTPQWQATNGGIWSRIEGLARNWAIDRGEVYVITGPMFYDPAEEDEATATGFVKHQLQGNGVAVPTHYYKIIVAVDAQNHPSEIVSFVIPNLKKSDGSKPADHLQSVRWIEDRTGLNFMPNETSARQEQLETAINPMWN